MIKIELLREELTAAGINFYFANLDDDGLLNVRFVEGGVKRMPTQAEQAQIEAVVAAHNPNGLTQAEQLRNAIRTTAQGAVGVALNDLTQAQIKALVAILLWKAGAVDGDLKVRPLSEWAR